MHTTALPRRSHPARPRIASVWKPLALACAAALSLAACSADPAAPPADVPQETPGATSTPDDQGNQADLDSVTPAALAAIDLAEAEAGGIAYELDDEDDRSAWQIDVDVNGEKVEVTVSWDGTQVLSSERDDSVDSDDRDRLAMAQVSIQDAIVIAAGEVSGGVTTADLTDDRGAVTWEIEFDDDDRDVHVDVVTGDVVRVD